MRVYILHISSYLVRGAPLLLVKRVLWRQRGKTLQRKMLVAQHRSTMQCECRCPLQEVRAMCAFFSEEKKNVSHEPNTVGLPLR